MWWWLALAIGSEVTATMSLRYSESFTKLVPSILVTLGYAIAFYALSRALMHGMSVGTAYATWCGIGMFVIAGLGALLFDERLTGIQVAGLALIVVGIMALQLGAVEASPSAPAPDEITSPI